MKDSVEESLDEKLASLKLEVAPPRDLWPGIARHVRHRPRYIRPPALAAAAVFAAACLASVLTWAVLRGRPAASPAPTTAGPALFEEPRNPGYLAARHDLESSFHARLALLQPATRAQIEASLAVIRQAHEDIRKALARDPANQVLEQLYQSTWHDELDLYDHVVRATQPMTRT
jgi:hypothetical protein